jgi:SAM-dependent methyltransferase
MSNKEYDLWADYYDIVHTGLPGEAEFYVGQAVRTNGATLELGCGTGRICIPMAMSGVDVVGLDNSKAMLRLCRQKMRAVGKTPGLLRLIERDMRRFELEQTFDLILMAYRTFMHLLTPEDRHACLARVYDHLALGGTFIVSLWAARSEDFAQYPSSGPRTVAFAGRYALPEGGGELIHFVSSACDELRQTIEEEHIIHEVNARAEATHTALLPMRRAWTSPEQMNALLTEHGFRIEALFGDFDCNPFTEKSTEMIWVAKK